MELRIWVSVNGEPVTDDRPEEFFNALLTSIQAEHAMSSASKVFQVEGELTE